MKDAFIYDAIRSPRGKGKEGGALSSVKPVALMAQVMNALAERNDLDTAAVDDVILGCVTAVGDQGADIAKISALYAGWADTVSGATVNRFCASGIDAVHTAAMKVSTSTAELVCAGGVESMSRVPIFGDKGAWFGDPEVAKRTGFVHMGVAADFVASSQGISRAELDAYAARSHQRAARAQSEGHFQSVVTIETDHGLASTDELIRPQTSEDNLAKLPALFEGEAFEPSKQVFAARHPGQSIDALHTVGTSPGIADGASLALIGSESAGKRHNLGPMARIVGMAVAGVDPVVMLRGNIDAARKALTHASLTAADIDVFEVNESFAAVPIDFARALDIDSGKLNPCGGAIALGHPLGATGGCLLSMAIDELHRAQGRYALISICGGAGVAAAVIIERC
ncbi:MAG: acetyl-CoA C-acyltransferase [Deltaproteobacteria bacterium]|nr:acetyl-CoA C-acyltransferase [Deltaproteobacteria bacterium]